MNIDTSLLSAIISATVALFVAVLNHFIVTPIKEKKELKRNQLTILYAPLYSLICLRISIVKDFSLSKRKLMLGDIGDIGYQKKEFMEKLIMDRSGYCFNDLMEAWVNYASQFGSFDKKYTEELVKSVVRGYNQLRKELKLPYDKDELNTGIPEVIKEYREFI
ncbi:hypothetical protein GCM10011351_28250 [Paraliobacillus quinghaiensis]|uniref:DUF4760 domain-containing protein n=1 Tax=Paraliobacillus quinghaiensis TaxID=470815 RepID=A0A917TVS7_9BACI|nr:hypothetical protein [Paraliobacillus quinghaiensis]GGM40441.1 hypothetical protein GCM10011351_28250 [Paraliobacillus quinghaiensis]